MGRTLTTLSSATLLLFAAAPGDTARADIIVSGGGLTLAQEGGSFDAGNVSPSGSAFALNIEGQDGGTPQQPTGYGGIHTTTGVNNLQYGNTGAWLAGSPNSFVGINLGSTPQTLSSIAFGRDNGGEPQQFTDRWPSLYTLQYTTVPNPDNTLGESPDPAGGFSTIGFIDYRGGPHTGIGGSNFNVPYIRHRFNFDPVSATGLRVVTSNAGTGIDELELYPTAGAVTPVPPPRATLVGSGGTAAGTGNNLASQANGATAFAQDALVAGTHSIAGVNDSVYGNSSSWIGANNGQGSYVGIDFAGADPLAIGQIAFGRDNGGEATEFTDRTDGVYTLQYTTVADPAGNAGNDAAWTTIETINYGPGFLDGERHLRHLYAFDAVSATGIRLLVSNNQIAIDELEAFAPIPEPTAAGLLTVAGAFALRRRRQVR